MSKRDLFVAVADLDAENTIKTLLGERQAALGVKLQFNPDRPPQGDLLRYSGRDSGCFKNAVNLLRAPQRTHRHAMLMFDHHGSGGEKQACDQIEADLEESLCANGWGVDKISVIVIEPELEAWVWSSSPQVARILGWPHTQLHSFLKEAELWDDTASKPRDPKKAMELALKEKQKPRAAPIYAQLAAHVGVKQCHDRAFIKLKKTLKRWFPVD